MRSRRLPISERLLAYFAVVFAVAFNLQQLYAEVAVRIPWLNDDVLHVLGLRQTVQAWLSGQDPTDSWLPSIGLGFPLFHHYQHLAYLPPALVSVLLGQTVPLPDVLAGTSYLLLSVFPVSMYWSMRQFGLDRLAAAGGAVCAPLVATGGLLGFDFASYVWSGFGLYTQLWGMVLLPPALAKGYGVLRDGRGYFWAVLLLAGTMLSHLILGYIGLGSLVVLALAASPTRRAIWPRIVRLGLLLVPLALVAAYFVVPFLMDSAYMNRSVWELPSKYDSYGHAWVLSALVRGELFDHGRVPVLTVLAGAGLVVCAVRWRDVRYRVPVAVAVMWLLLYFGRPTWGGLLDLLPMSRDLHFHRLIAGVHLGGVYLMGVGLALAWQAAWSMRGARYLLGAAALTLLLLSPAYRERVGYLAENSRLMSLSRDQLSADQANLNELVAALREAPPGRVYAGLGANWGRNYQVGFVPMYALLNNAGLDMVGYLYHALSLNSDLEPLFDENRPEQYDLFNIRYVVAPIGHQFPDFVKPVRDFGRHRLYEVETSGYFELVQSNVALVGDKSQFYSAAAAWLASDMPGLKQHPAVSFGGSTASQRDVLPLQAAGVVARTPSPRRPAGGQILAETVESNAYRAAVDLERQSTLLLKATYHPNWRAFVDGVEVRTSMVMPSYISLEVPPGLHGVALEYRPPPLRLYLWILGLLTLAVLAVMEWRREPLPSPGWPFKLPALDWDNLRARRVAARRPVRDMRDWRAFRPRAPQTWRWPSLMRLRVVLAVYALFLSIYLMFASGHFLSTDQVAVYLTTQSIIERLSLAIKPINDAVAGPDGQYYATFGIGQSLVSIPLYLAGRLVDQVSPPPVRAYFAGPMLCGPTPYGDSSCDWGGTVPIFFVSLLNQLLAPVTCVVVFLFSRRLGCSPRRALLVTMLFGLATATWVYAEQAFQHTIETLTLLVATYTLFSNRDQLSSKHVVFAGACFALGVLTRLNMLLAIPFLLTYVYAMSDRLGRTEAISADARRLLARRNTFLFASPLIVVICIVLCVNYLKFGQVLDYNPNASAKGFGTPLLVGLYGNLFSVGRSIFIYSPPLVLGLLGFREFYSKYRAEALLFAAICSLYLFVYSVYGYWDGGWAWGPRLLVPLIPLLLLPIGLWMTSRARMIAVGVAAAVGAGVQLLGVVVGYSYVYQDWLGMRLVPDNAFLFVPDISPIPMHWRALLGGRYIDLWLAWVGQAFGPGVLVLSLVGPTTMLLVAAVVLAREMRLVAGGAWRGGEVAVSGAERPTRVLGVPWLGAHTDRQLGAAVLIGSLAVGAVLRLWLSFTDDGIYWPDEIYQSLEPAHRLVFGYGLVAWEFQEGARNWALPAFCAGLLKLATWIDLSEPPGYVWLVRVAFSLISLATAFAVFQLARAYRTSSLAAGIAAAMFVLAGPTIYFAPRALSETASALPVVLGFALALSPVSQRWQRLLGASLLGAAVLLRLQTAVFCVGLVAVFAARKQWRFALEAASMLMVWALLYGLVDRLTWGVWFQSAIVYVRSNLVEGLAELQGTAPADYYVRTLWTSMGWSMLLMVPLSLLGAVRARGLALIVVTFLAVHSAIGHKELRFVFAAIPLLCAMAGIGLDEVRNRWPAVPARIATGTLLAAGVVSAAGFHSLTFGDLGLYLDLPGRVLPVRSDVSAYDDFGSVNRLMLMARERPDLCGLRFEGVAMGWTGGYTYLHRPVPIYAAEPLFRTNQPPPAPDVLNYAIAPTIPSRGGDVVATDKDFALVRLFPGSCTGS